MILYNFANSGTSETIKNRLNIVILKDERRHFDRNLRDDQGLRFKYQLQLEFLAFHAMKRLNPIEMIPLMKAHDFFTESVINIMVDNNDLDAFKIIFIHCHRLELNYIPAVHFIARNHNELFSTLIGFVKNCPLHGFCSCYDNVSECIKALITNSASEDDLLDSLRSLKQIQPKTHYYINLNQLYCYTSEFIKTPHDLVFFKAILDFTNKRSEPCFKFLYTLLLESENWPSRGTWPQAFFRPDEADNEWWTCNKSEMKIIEKTL